ncbi:site-2 protease family protein [Thalassobacillus hwangdonensis]|uniref:Site-2 protease family protein n=1 Tax=Thalassobacillus hwangdonensis TaxID=546108 RepID=A0ABW3KYD6_9BACI
MNNLKLHPLIHLHPILILFVLTSIWTGAFFELLILFVTVSIHEYGHFWMARRFGWRIQKVTLWLFGGTMVCDEHGSRPFKEQLLVTLAGPLQHVWMLLALYGLIPFVSPQVDHLIHLAIFYNWLILGFNLLPVWPLDGGKLAFYFFSRWIPYRTAHHTIILFSIGFLICLILFFATTGLFTLHGILLACFLLVENRLEWKQRYYTFIRFLLFRQRMAERMKEVRTIHLDSQWTVWKVLTNIRSDRQYNYLVDEGKVVKEKDCLDSFFQQGNPHLLLYELISDRK